MAFNSVIYAMCPCDFAGYAQSIVIILQFYHKTLLVVSLIQNLVFQIRKIIQKFFIKYYKIEMYYSMYINAIIQYSHT